MKPIKVLSGVSLDVGNGDALPTEVLILRRGRNETAKGPIVFDDAAARDVMAAFARGGVDLPIDLEHRSVDPSPAVRTSRDATDAVGWFRLAVRNGDLYMTDIRWTAEGRARLLARKQRYISPVVAFTPDDERAREIINCALVAMPATHGALPLIAASRGVGADSVTVAARVPVNLATQVAARALQRGITTGEYIRHTLSSAVTDAQPDELTRALALRAQHRQRLKKMRERERKNGMKGREK